MEFPGQLRAIEGRRLNPGDPGNGKYQEMEAAIGCPTCDWCQDDHSRSIGLSCHHPAGAAIELVFGIIVCWHYRKGLLR